MDCFFYLVLALAQLRVLLDEAELLEQDAAKSLDQALALGVERRAVDQADATERADLLKVCVLKLGAFVRVDDQRVLLLLREHLTEEFVKNQGFLFLSALAQAFLLWWSTMLST